MCFKRRWSYDCESVREPSHVMATRALGTSCVLKPATGAVATLRRVLKPTPRGIQKNEPLRRARSSHNALPAERWVS